MANTDLLTQMHTMLDAVLSTDAPAEVLCRRCEQEPRYRGDSEHCLNCDLAEMEYDRERKEDR